MTTEGSLEVWPEIAAELGAKTAKSRRSSVAMTAEWYKHDTNAQQRLLLLLLLLLLLCGPFSEHVHAKGSGSMDCTGAEEDVVGSAAWL